MEKPKNPFRGDIAAAVLSVILFEYTANAIRIDGETNVFRIVTDLIAGCLAYLIAFLLFSEKLDFAKRRYILYPTVLGSTIWVLYKIVKGLVLDWDFLSEHPEALYARHVSSGIKAFVFLVPMLSLSSISFVLVSRLIRRRTASLMSERLS